jgi:O-antigen ligase
VNLRLAPSPLRHSPAGLASGSAAVWVGAVVLTLGTGAVLVRMGPAIAIAMLAAPLIAALVLFRPAAAFLLFVGCAIVVPYYLAAGSQQAAAFRLEAAGAVAAVAVFALYAGKRAQPRTVDWIVVVFLLSAFVSWAVFGGSLKTTINTILPISFYFAARGLSRERVWSILWVVLGAGALAALTVLYEGLVVGSAVFISPDQYLWNASGQALFRPGGVFASPPGAVSVLAMTSICGLAVIARARGTQRMLAIVLTLICVAGAIDTFTRAGYIGIAAGATAYVFLARSTVFTPRRFLILAGTVAVIFSVVFLPALSTATWYQQGVLRKGNLAIRESYWTLAKPLITDSPQDLVFGHGIDSLTSQSSTGGPSVGISQSLSTSPTLTTIGPHNQFVRILLEQGLVGILLVAGWLGGACIAAIARVRTVAPELRPVIAALVGATISFVLVASANDSMRHPPSLALIALVTGMLVTITASAGKDNRQGGTP